MRGPTKVRLAQVPCCTDEVAGDVIWEGFGFFSSLLTLVAAAPFSCAHAYMMQDVIRLLTRGGAGDLLGRRLTACSWALSDEDKCFLWSGGGGVAVTARVLEKGIDWLSRSEATGIRVTGYISSGLHQYLALMSRSRVWRGIANLAVGSHASSVGRQCGQVDEWDGCVCAAVRVVGSCCCRDRASLCDPLALCGQLAAS
jgi:hypothetical protein